MQETVIIRKQRLRIRTTDPETAPGLGKKVGAYLSSVIIPALERAFNFIGPVERVIEFDTIKIDLGKLPAGSFEKQLPGLLAVELERELVKLLGRQYRDVHLPAKGKRDFVNGAPSGEKEYDRKNGRKDYQQEEYHYRAILYYLEKGIFPWDYERMAFKKDPARILADLGEDELRKIIALYLSVREPVPVLRLFEHYPRDRQGKLPEILLDELKNETVTGISRFFYGQKELLTRELPLGRKSFDRLMVNFMVLNGAEAGKPDPVQLIEELLALFGEARQGPGPAHKLAEKALQLLAGKIKPLKGTSGLRDKSTEQALNVISKKTRLTPARKEGSDKEGKRRELPENVVYINNAGIIILHPFLEALFRELGLLTEKHEFVSGESRLKAAVILNYLFERKDEYRDWEMTLNKVICNISRKDVFPADIKLTGAEKAECDNLLDTVAGHWTALKGAGAEAMQATFFRREGRLSAVENSWLLQIGHKTEDILIQKLPWGLGVVKFTWNDKPIFVQW
jgi:hypothetical protein